MIKLSNQCYWLVVDRAILITHIDEQLNKNFMISPPTNRLIPTVLK